VGWVRQSRGAGFLRLSVLRALSSRSVKWWGVIFGGGVGWELSRVFSFFFTTFTLLLSLIFYFLYWYIT
jgi:hypothetical protein